MAAAPLRLHREPVRPEWIDYNGHMNVAFYVLAFDHASDALFDHLDIGEDYRRRANGSMFAIEGHITYDREVGEGAPLAFETTLLGVDAKRLQYFHRMVHGETGESLSGMEVMAIHVDMQTRRAAPFPADVLERLEALAKEHKTLERPAQVGRGVRQLG